MLVVKDAALTQSDRYLLAMNPVIHIKYGQQKLKTKVCVKGDLKPHWNEEFHLIADET